MKRIFKKTSILALSFSLLFSLGCNKYIDVEPQFTIDAENYFNTPSDYDQALIGAYDLLQSSFILIWIGEIASDNSIAGGESGVCPVFRRSCRH